MGAVALEVQEDSAEKHKLIVMARKNLKVAWGRLLLGSTDIVGDATKITDTAAGVYVTRVQQQVDSGSIAT